MGADAEGHDLRVLVEPALLGFTTRYLYPVVACTVRGMNPVVTQQLPGMATLGLEPSPIFSPVLFLLENNLEIYREVTNEIYMFPAPLLFLSPHSIVYFELPKMKLHNVPFSFLPFLFFFGGGGGVKNTERGQHCLSCAVQHQRCLPNLSRAPC